MASTLRKYVAEGTLIVFSVLFALFINSMWAQWQLRQEKAVALASIQQELARNAHILTRWQRDHAAVRDRIGDLLDGKRDSLRAELLRSDFLDLGVLTNNQSLVDAILTATAWETARSTGIVREFEFGVLEQLTEVYMLQEILSTQTVPKILDLYFERASHDLDNLDATLRQLHLLIWELTGQEALLDELYQEVLTTLDPP